MIIVDLYPRRRDLALEFGASVALDQVSRDVAATIGAVTSHRGADVVIEISGSYHAHHEAVRAAAYGSRVVVSGCFQGPANPVRLVEEFHHNRVSIFGSQISGVSPALQHCWDELRMSRTVLDLERAGELRLTELVTHTFAADGAPAAFEMLDLAAEPALQVVLDYGDAT